MDDMLYLVIMWAGVLVSYNLANRTKLTPVLFFLAFGSLMVNTGILPHDSSEFIRGFAEIGIILIMFALGFEEDSNHFVKGIKRSWGIALFGALAPFALAYSVIMIFWGDQRIALICAMAMTATAVSLTMVSLKSENLQRTGAATGIMTSAILDDVAALAAVAILIPIITGEAEVSVTGIAFILSKAFLFFFIITIFELFLFPHKSNLPLFNKLPFLRSFGIRNFLRMSGGQHATLALLLIALLIGLLSYSLGFHPAVGAYMAGLIMKEEYFHFHDEAGDTYKESKKIIDNVAFSWIGPVFFVQLGTQIAFEKSILVSVIPQIIVLAFGLLIVQILSAGLAAKYTGNFAWHESIMIGFGMLGRAELAFVVMDIGYVQTQIITTDVFYTLMATTFFLNIAVPVLIAWWKPYFVGEKMMRLGRGENAIYLSKPPSKALSNSP
ncbi:MAG: cation/H(+) antiporter [SAR86 cluster bacterium]|uniref:Cation/H(+) antiporter n=1 Tax=SAR86 cluster bacterium TaxID=2030880 RepID=A0A2A5CCB2_9GAMM|nr:cation:proton antiporter [Gammaproteobacteria bacterium AH-315-E17]PCJ41524.1 MAG: cation/H(+) antiporter [SAR86 cluster bacterium]